MTFLGSCGNKKLVDQYMSPRHLESMDYILYEIQKLKKLVKCNYLNLCVINAYLSICVIFASLSTFL